MDNTQIEGYSAHIPTTSTHLISFTLSLPASALQLEIQMEQGLGPSTSKHLPADILDAITAAVSNSATPHLCSSLDPIYLNTPNVQATSPACPTPLYWPEPVARKTLASLCLVNKDFRDAAKPWLWRRIQVKFPRNWLGILDEICGDDEEPTQQNIPTVIASDCQVLCTPSSHPSSPSIGQGEVVQEELFTILNGKEPCELASSSPLGFGSVPLDLLSPCPSRSPSPRRLRRQSSGRWRFIREVNRRLHPEPGLYGMQIKGC